MLREPRSSALDLSHYVKRANEPPLSSAALAAADRVRVTQEPRTLLTEPPPENMYWNMSLEEALQSAVTHSTVMRDLGGTIVRVPSAMQTILDPALQETDPRVGVHAALSAFDAAYSASLGAEKNDRPFNNLFTAGGTRLFQQDLLLFQHQISKRGAAGTQSTIRQNIDYDNNNALANLFPSSWNTNIEAEVRQPLLQGGGAEFNRIAGPSGVAGVYNGVVIAQTNNDISLAEFEVGLRNLVSNVENAYWDLYFAYRDLDSKIAARDAALDIWRKIEARRGSERGSAEREAQAREQYYRFEEEVQNALAGRPGDGTATNNGTTGGTFRGVGGVLYSERRLRLMLGIDLRDERLLRPTDEPCLASTSFDWNIISAEGIVRRAELRRQRLEIRRREQELVAARNFLLPQLDLVGRYRWLGFGQDLISSERQPDPFDSAFQNLTTGDFQEWRLGAEMTIPIGFRRGHAAVRNAQLQVARERALLDEQERQILYDLSNAFSELQRAYQVSQTAYNRRMAAKANVELLRERMNWDPQLSLDQLLDAERRYADADVRYHRATVEYALALKNVHLEKGTLLDYGGIYLSGDEQHHSEVLQKAKSNRLLNSGGELLNYVIQKSSSLAPGSFAPNSEAEISNNADHVTGPEQDPTSQEWRPRDETNWSEPPLPDPRAFSPETSPPWPAP
jgi:outer membrane protein TolC